MTAPITPAIKAAHACGGHVGLLALCDTPIKRMILPFIHAFWLRPEQVIPDDGWKWFVMRGGRGWGKTYAIACYLTRQVIEGNAKAIALMATNEDRVYEIQAKALIAAAPPWFRPVWEDDGLTWPNGVRAEVFTPEAPDAIRSENLTHTWLSEVLAWPATKRKLAFQNATTATRRGRAQVLIDTTAQGRNDVITLINKMHAADPRLYRVVRGSMVDNPIFSADYLRSEFLKYVEGSRRFEEEVNGKDFDDALGALWSTDVIEATRRLVAPEPLELVLIGADPAYSDRSDADETGLILAGREAGHTYLTRDLSGQHSPDKWSNLICTTAIAARASGAVIEVNSTSRLIPTVLAGACKTHGLVMIELKPGQPFPPYRAGVLHVRLVVSREDKYTRATGPAGESIAGRLHIVGDMPELEDQLCTFEPDSKQKSPGRYDAAVHVVNELAGLVGAQAEDNAPGVVGASVAAAALNRSLASAAAGRRVGM